MRVTALFEALLVDLASVKQLLEEKGGSYLRLMVVHALSLVRHSHGNTSTVHGTNSSSVY